MAMGKRKSASSPEKLRPDAAEVAFRVMQEAIGEAPKTLPPSERTEKNSDAVNKRRDLSDPACKDRTQVFISLFTTDSLFNDC